MVHGVGTLRSRSLSVRTIDSLDEVTVLIPAAGRVSEGLLALSNIACRTKSALMVLGDTHFKLTDASLLQTDTPFVLTSPVEESYRWCVAKATPDGIFARLRDKEADLITPLEALKGKVACGAPSR